jgi:hypothetical protein
MSELRVVCAGRHEEENMMRTILTSLAAASALALAASPAYAGGGLGGCSSSYEQVVESTMPEETVAMSTFDGTVAVEDEVAVTETVCADGDADCLTPPAE